MVVLAAAGIFAITVAGGAAPYTVIPGAVAIGSGAFSVVAGIVEVCKAVTARAPGVGAAGTGADATTAACPRLGPVGLIILGTEESRVADEYAFDCWKAVLHDQSPEPSRGMLLRDVVSDARVKSATLAMDDGNSIGVYPMILLENVWGEKFDIQYVYLPALNQVAAHAVMIQ